LNNKIIKGVLIMKKYLFGFYPEEGSSVAVVASSVEEATQIVREKAKEYNKDCSFLDDPDLECMMQLPITEALFFD